MSFVSDLANEYVVQPAQDLIGGITGTTAAAEAAQQAAETQAAAAQAGIGVQREQFNRIVELMSPFVTAGTGSLAAQQALLGLQGPEAQQQAITSLQSSPQFQALVSQGENAILQNAAATGGLRGGNVQGALSQFRPGMLSQLIQQQFQNLGGITQLGQAAAGGQAAQGAATAGNIANLLQQQGAATAGGQLAAGYAPLQTFNQVANIGGLLYGAGVFGKGAGTAGSGTVAAPSSVSNILPPF